MFEDLLIFQRQRFTKNMLGSIARHMRLPTIASPCWGVLFVICGYLHYCASHEENPSILMLSQPARVGVYATRLVGPEDQQKNTRAHLERGDGLESQSNAWLQYKISV
jgi:hypothetical protein